ncbi:hypothetical protein [Clostridium thermobutyricum]|uniref:hypothetical protein n=1 Tax=Clostridium thermobutyricum TaxID=29372 RepID=UPI0029434A38|nr:hypothetical protein [Clostridium thermobutyricum]
MEESKEFVIEQIIKIVRELKDYNLTQKDVDILFECMNKQDKLKDKKHSRIETGFNEATGLAEQNFVSIIVKDSDLIENDRVALIGGGVITYGIVIRVVNYKNIEEFTILEIKLE